MIWVAVVLALAGGVGSFYFSTRPRDTGRYRRQMLVYQELLDEADRNKDVRKFLTENPFLLDDAELDAIVRHFFGFDPDALRREAAQRNQEN